MSNTRLASAGRGALAVAVLACSSLSAGDAAVEPRVPGALDRCAVCGMFVAPHPEWLAQIVFDDDSVAFFDGAKDLFRYVFARDRYLPQQRGREIVAVYVTGYYDLTALDARSAVFVIGSDVLGPMGSELVAFVSAEDAAEFRTDHAGSRIVRFEEVTRELVKTLD